MHNRDQKKQVSAIMRLKKLQMHDKTQIGLERVGPLALSMTSSMDSKRALSMTSSMDAPREGKV